MISQIINLIVESADDANVTEWRKSPKCWMHIISLSLDLPEIQKNELDLEAVEHNTGVTTVNITELSTEERANIAKVMKLSAS